MLLGNHFIKGWSKTQRLVAISSGEAELYAGIKAASETLGMVFMLADIGRVLQGHVFSDSSAALGMVKGRGLGKTRHIQTSFLWIQDQHENRTLGFDYPSKAP